LKRDSGNLQQKATCLGLVDECVLIPLKLPAARLLPLCGPDGQVIGHQDEPARPCNVSSSIEVAVSDEHQLARWPQCLEHTLTLHDRTSGSALGLLLVVIAIYGCPRVPAECCAEGERSTACKICSSASVVQQRLQVSIRPRGALSPCRPVHCLGAVTDASLSCPHPSLLYTFQWASGLLRGSVQIECCDQMPPRCLHSAGSACLNDQFPVLLLLVQLSTSWVATIWPSEPGQMHLNKVLSAL
jgi:hypothetical protein